jgi:hypothetical protein
MAQQFIGVRSLRVVRAARATLAGGYEPESRAHDRILVELGAHRRAILDDESGKTALDWLKGKSRRGVTARVNAMSPSDLYKNLSQDSHGDPEPIQRLAADATANTIYIEPRRTLATRASLLMHAGFCRDQAVVIAQAAGIQLNGLPELDEAIRGGWDALESEYESDSS